MPDYPLEIDYPFSETQKPFKVIVSSLFSASEKRVMDNNAHELSIVKWPGTDLPMFNVTLVTDKGNHKMKNKESATFRLA
jgi:hypothetical protein